MKKKWICTVCGYVHEGDEAPEFCPQCKQPKSKFKEMVETTGALTFADEHVIGVAKGCDEEMIKDLNAHFMGECTEVGMYLAMSRQADREGYPEVAEAFKRYAWEEAEHAAKFAELLGDVVWDTKTNLEKRKDAECGACEDKKRIATRAKQLNLDAIHDTVHEMCKDEARHGKGFEGHSFRRVPFLLEKNAFEGTTNLNFPYICIRKRRPKESCQSGRMGRTRNAVYG